MLGKFLVTLGGPTHGNVEVLQTLDVRFRVLPRLDGRRALDGDVAPGVELDDGDSRPACPLDVLNLDGVPPRREPDLTIQHGRRDDGRLRAALWRDGDRNTGWFASD